MSWVSLGTITVATPGTRIQLTANQSDPTKRVPTQAILIQAISSAAHTNSGRAYLYAAKTGGSPLAVLAVPTANIIPSACASATNAPGAFNCADFWIDADNASDGVYASRYGP